MIINAAYTTWIRSEIARQLRHEPGLVDAYVVGSVRGILTSYNGAFPAACVAEIAELLDMLDEERRDRHRALELERRAAHPPVTPPRQARELDSGQPQKAS